MMKLLKSILLMTVTAACAAGGERSVLWYEQSATNWYGALPIGSGRLGAMVYGDTAHETIALNEDTLWSGGPHDYTNYGAKEYLPELRKLIRAEKYDEAAEFGLKHSIGLPRGQKAYQSLGRLKLSFQGHDEVTGYRRQLDLSDALVSVQYTAGDVAYSREAFASFPNQVIAMRFTADKPGQLTFDATFTSEHKKYAVEAYGPDSIAIRGKADEVAFQSVLQMRTEGGKVTVSEGTLSVKGADSVVLLLVAATNYKNFEDLSGDPDTRCKNYLAAVEKQSYKTLREAHIADHSALYDRIDIDLGATPEELALPTDQLIERVKSGTHSNLLDEQLFRLARYLHIAGARPGTQPLNLVGIWVRGLKAPWGGKWTLNINAELNTWPVEVGNLAECHEPLLTLLEDLRVTGRKVAREHYDCRGFVAHHNTDLWRGTAPVDTAIHGLWPMGSAWLCRHIWEHYDFSRDTAFLKRSYPTMKEAALFYEDYLTEDRDGNLSTCPAISFEQSFKKADGTPGRLTYGPTMDNQILRDLLSNCIAAAQTLGVDEDQQALWKKMMGRLRPTQIDPVTGRVMEWAFRAEQHTYVTGQTAPMWGVSPGRQINHMDTPDLAAAAEKHMEFTWARMSRDQNSGSWVTGTFLNIYARLHNVEGVCKTIERAQKDKLYPNLLMHFHRQKYFQIDGNMGLAAGVAQMLLQSHRLNDSNEPILDLLPTLPPWWSTGSISGFRARGAFTVDMSWNNGALTKLHVRSNKGGPLHLKYGKKEVSLNTVPGKTYNITDFNWQNQ